MFYDLIKMADSLANDVYSNLKLVEPNYSKKTENGIEYVIPVPEGIKEDGIEIGISENKITFSYSFTDGDNKSSFAMEETLPKDADYEQAVADFDEEKHEVKITIPKKKCEPKKPCRLQINRHK